MIVHTYLSDGASFIYIKTVNSSTQYHSVTLRHSVTFRTKSDLKIENVNNNNSAKVKDGTRDTRDEGTRDEGTREKIETRWQHWEQNRDKVAALGTK